MRSETDNSIYQRPLFKRLVPLLGLIHLSSFGSGQTIRVLAAASLKEPITILAKQFESSHPGEHVSLSFGGSDTFATAIIVGGDVDLFLSADKTQMERTIEAHRILVKNVHPLATNQLVIVVNARNSTSITSLIDLAKPQTRIAMARPTVPAGKYAREMLQQANLIYGKEFSGKVLDNVVTYDTDVRQVLAHVATGSADAGFVYLTDELAGGSRVTAILLPKSLATVAHYSIGVVKDGNNPQIAVQFMSLILSKEGQKVLQSRGFGPRIASRTTK